MLLMDRSEFTKRLHNVERSCSTDELKAFNNQWEKEKDHFFDSVNIRLAYKGPIEEE